MATPSRNDVVPEILAVAGEFLRASERLFRPEGVTAAQYNVLVALARHPDGISQRELSELLVVDRSNVTGLLNRMEKAGWVSRRDHPSDRRVYQVTLTASGQRLARRLERLYEAAAARVTAGISATDAASLLELLARLKRQAASWR